MICPHCRTSLLRKQRTGNRCSRCRKEFAFDPKTNLLRLHDLRVQHLAQSLSTRGRDGLPPLGYTADQLRLAASRKVLATPSTASGWQAGMAVLGLVALALGFAALVTGTASLGVLALVVLGLVGLLVVGHRSTAEQRRYPGVPISSIQFAGLLSRWAGVYGGPPAGLLPAGPARTVLPAGPPRAVLLCPDRSTVAFLAAAGVAERYPVALVPGSAGRVPPEASAAARDGLPVLVLHDADARGCLEVARLRAVLRARVVDVGLRPRTARRARVLVRQRPPDGALDELRAAGDLADDELAWLAEGRALPLAAVLPSRLLHAVERAVERAVADPDQAAARAVGFLSGPPEAR